jgi:hypothetical protein
MEMYCYRIVVFAVTRHMIILLHCLHSWGDFLCGFIISYISKHLFSARGSHVVTLLFLRKTRLTLILIIVYFKPSQNLIKI